MENIFKAEDIPASVVAAGMEDPGKRAIILKYGYTHIGVGYYNGYWVQFFAKE